jgi:hypothetical protein
MIHNNNMIITIITREYIYIIQCVLAYVPWTNVSCGLAEVEGVAQEITLARLNGNSADLLHLVDPTGVESNTWKREEEGERRRERGVEKESERGRE